MNVDFLWQNAIWVVLGLALSAAWRWMHTRVRRRSLRRFFGAEALGETGIVLSVPVALPLSRDDFDRDAEVTTGHKLDDAGVRVRRPIYGEMLHFDDFKAAEELFALLRELGAKRSELVPDADSLDRWEESPCVVCLGSPFVNATMGELLRLADDDGGAPIAVTRTSDTLDTYRLALRRPTRLTLGVDRAHALGAVVRLPHPSRPGAWVIGVWGCRAASTHATARHLHRHFTQIAAFAEPHKPLVVLLAVLGREREIVKPMYVATDRALLRDERLLCHYDRSPDAGRPDDSATATFQDA